MLLHVLALLACALAIYFACELFVNAVEWLGVRLKMGTIAIGTVLAAIGTALPESVVTLVAVTMGNSPESKDIGVGAAMGGPLALATVAYGVSGYMLLSKKRGPHPLKNVDLTQLPKDQKWFLAIFILKVALGLVTFSFKPWLGLLFFAAYGAYFIKEMRADSEKHSDMDLEPLKLQPRKKVPAGWAVLAQTLGSLAVIFVSSHLFVGQLEWIGPELGLSATVTALLLSPVATELPEIMNAIIWIRQGKISLALANISGAMMIQATVPSGLGILFTPWKFDGPLILAGVVTMIAIVYLLILFKTKRFEPYRLSASAAFYGIFAIGLILLG
ncbi:MAG: sodium:calcium antiporter [Candidatus Planktophila sp.]|nr:sodium:calcium antiporter [Candidatus Planktophila sp.]